MEQKPVEWLWPSQVRGIDAWKAKAPGDLSTRQKANWAKEQQAKQIEFATDALKDRLRPGAHLEVELVKGELRVHDDGTTVLDGVFVNAKEAKQVLIDWRNYLRVNPITETPDAVNLASNLQCVRTTDNTAVAKQIADLDADLARVGREIAKAEDSLNKMADSLYGLSAAEISIVYAKNQ